MGEIVITKSRECKTTNLLHEVICVAGHKVTSDPIAIPFSMGRNLVRFVYFSVERTTTH